MLMKANVRVGPVLAALLTLSQTAAADEPRKVTEPMVMREPGNIVNVVDAFDGPDDFDMNISLGYERIWKTSKLVRETHMSELEGSSGGYTAANTNVGTYTQDVSKLNTRVDIGLYHDVGLVFRMPIVLSDDRKIEAVDGSDTRQALILEGAVGEQLFQLPFESPTRSGIEYLAVGLDFGIMNQWRDPTKPTWVFGIEGRFNVSEPMHACGKSGFVTGEDCAFPSDLNRNGIQDAPDGSAVDSGNNPIQLEGTNIGSSRAAGISRGTTLLEGHSFLSKRIQYLEPYACMRAFFEFQNKNSDFGKTDLQGALVNHPPFGGTMVAGMYIIPWEVYDRFQRIAFDVRLKGTYRSQGRDYTELFDALGSSSSPSLRRPNYAQYQGFNPADGASGTDAAIESVVNTNSQKVYFTGITDVQQHGIYAVNGSFLWQAGEYIKFDLGGGLTWVQGHLITYDQPCNPDFAGGTDVAGPCRTSSASGDAVATGIPNPNYRPGINVPGRRFKVESSTELNAWVNATVMF